MEFTLNQDARGFIAFEKGSIKPIELCQDMDNEGEPYYFENLDDLTALMQEWMWSIGEKELKIIFKVRD